jgi:hypothetical protein
MLDFVVGRTSERKLRLFAVACCRRAAHLLTDRRALRSLEVAAEFADRRPTEAARQAAEAAANGAWMIARERFFAKVTGAEEELAAADAVLAAIRGDTSDVHTAARSAAVAIAPDTDETEVADEDSPLRLAESEQQCHLLRDLIGPQPFRQVPTDPAVQSRDAGSVLRLARLTYEDCSFGRFPTLADALEDAGRTDRDILDHCRGRGPHVRGCWVLDLLLGKS